VGLPDGQEGKKGRRGKRLEPFFAVTVKGASRSGRTVCIPPPQKGRQKKKKKAKGAFLYEEGKVKQSP